MELDYLTKKGGAGLNLLDAFANFLAYIVSVLFAVSLIGHFIPIEHAAWVWLVLGAGILTANIVNFLLSRKYRDRFYSWDSILHTKNYRTILFLPPFSTLFFSFGLTVFILKFFVKTAEVSWQTSLGSLSGIYKIAGIYFILAWPLGLLFLFIIFYAIYLGARFFAKARSKLQKVFAFILASASILFIVLFVPVYFTPKINGERNIFLLLERTVEFLVSFSPAYWFYFLFIRNNGQ